MGELAFGELALSGGGYAVAVMGLFVGLLRFLKWIIDRGDRGLAKRLYHLELELDCYREATMLLINALAKQDPSNVALASAARILRKTPPRPTMELDELQRHLDEIPGRADQ